MIVVWISYFSPLFTFDFSILRVCWHLQGLLHSSSMSSLRRKEIIFLRCAGMTTRHDLYIRPSKRKPHTAETKRISCQEMTGLALAFYLLLHLLSCCIIATFPLSSTRAGLAFCSSVGV
jgi:hypothetical protein